MSELDLLTLGRVNLDLYAQQHGVGFTDVVGWDAMVGGSPVNVALAARRLEIRAGVLTAVGQDLVGDWVLQALGRQSVDTRFVARKSGPHTSLALRAQLPPDHPLAFYRHDPADIHLTPEDVADAPVEEVPAVLVSADALARGLMIDTCRSVLERAGAGSATIYVDLDLRDVNWIGHDAYATSVRPAVDEADAVIGTDAEFAALLGQDVADEPAIADAVQSRVATAGRVAVVKHGSRGATIFIPEHEPLIIVPFDTVEASSVGAGDSFAAGLIAARLNGSNWADSGRFAGACAAITVGRFGCSTGFPHLREVSTFLRARRALVATERA